MSDYNADPFGAGGAFVHAGTIIVSQAMLEDSPNVVSTVTADLLKAIQAAEQPREYLPPEPGTPEYEVHLVAVARAERQRGWERSVSHLCLCDEATGHGGDWCPVHGRDVQLPDREWW